MSDHPSLAKILAAANHRTGLPQGELQDRVHRVSGTGDECQMLDPCDARLSPPALKPSQMAEAHQRRARPNALARAAGRLGYALDPDFIAEVTREAVDRARRSPLSPEERRREMFAWVIDRLCDRCPGRIEREPEWVLTRCGGAEVTLGVIYGAPNEYLAFCGTNLGLTGADSGSYRADVWDFILEGENYNAGASPFDAVEVTRAGEVTFLPAGDRKKWSLTGPGWMLDYARGAVPTMFWHANIEAVFLTANLKALGSLVRTVGRGTLREARGRLSGRFSPANGV